MKLVDKIASDLLIPTDFVDHALANATTLVKLFKIKKRSGGTRTISHPARKLKNIQYWLINNVFDAIPVHSAAAAYRHSSSIRVNAEHHRENRYFLKIDFEDFFPSIKFADLAPIIRDWHAAQHLEWTFDSDAQDLIRRACFDKGGRLPIGYPSSPSISNIVMYTWDSRIAAALEGNPTKFGQAVYTRYADDLVFSTNTAGACPEILNLVKAHVRKGKSPRLKINHKKTRFSSSSGGSAIVTGLRIVRDGRITLHRNYKTNVRLLLKLFAADRLKPEEVPVLRGHLSFVRHNDPGFYTALARRHFEALAKLKG